MSDSTLISWSRKAAIVAGVSWPVVFVALLLIYMFVGALDPVAPPKETIDLETLGVASAFYVPFAVMGLALAGARLRWGEAWGLSGRLGFALALMGLVIFPIAYAAYIGGAPQDVEPSAMGRLGEVGFYLGGGFLSAGFLSYGLAAVRTATPSRRFGWTLIGAGALQGLVLPVSVLRVLGFSLAWIVIGLALPALERDPSDLDAATLGSGPSAT